MAFTRRSFESARASGLGKAQTLARAEAATRTVAALEGWPVARLALKLAAYRQMADLAWADCPVCGQPWTQGHDPETC